MNGSELAMRACGCRGDGTGCDPAFLIRDCTESPLAAVRFFSLSFDSLKDWQAIDVDQPTVCWTWTRMICPRFRRLPTRCRDPTTLSLLLPWKPRPLCHCSLVWSPEQLLKISFGLVANWTQHWPGLFHNLQLELLPSVIAWSLAFSACSVSV